LRKVKKEILRKPIMFSEKEHEKDVGCTKYCCFGEISSCYHELGPFTLACLHFQVANSMDELALKSSRFHG
jgi:hypothetical protein